MVDDNLNLKMIAEISRLLTRYEECMERVEFNHKGTRVTNPHQQGAANRFYNQAWRIAGDLDKQEFIRIHREVIDKRREK